MSHPVIPAPVRFEVADGQFTLRSGTLIAYQATELAPIAERCCEEISRRTGLRLEPTAQRRPGPDEPSIRVELAAGDELGENPQGLSPTGGPPPDDPHSLTV